MVIKDFDSTLEDIKSIKNILSIKIYDLINYKNDDSRKFILPAMIVVFDSDGGRKCLNLCAKDKYFNEFVKKVQSVYEKEKGQGSIFNDGYIYIDDNTKNDDIHVER